MDTRICRSPRPTVVRAQSPDMTSGSSVFWKYSVEQVRQLQRSRFRKAEEPSRNSHKCRMWKLRTSCAACFSNNPPNYCLHTNQPRITPRVSKNYQLGSAACKLPLRLFGVALQLRPLSSAAGPAPISAYL